MLLACATVFGSLVALDVANVTDAASERSWHVAPWGSDAADGSSAAPLRTITHAVRSAASGDAVVLSGGTYAESVQVYGKAIDLRSAPGERAVLDGGGQLGWGLYLNNADGSSVTDITVTNYATPDADMAAVRAYSDDVVLSGVHVVANRRMGLSAIGSSIFVTNGRFTDNGHLGVHGHRLDGFVVQYSAIHRNNAGGNDPFDSAGGLKVTESRGVTIRDSHVADNAGPGIWTDIDTTSVTIARNLVESNQRAGIQVELSANVNVLSNATVDNGEAGIWILESQAVQVLHNASFGNQQAIEVEEGPRRDVAGVRIDNNTLGAAAPGSRALLDVNDWTEARSAADMGVTADHNAYWVGPTSATANISRWARWPQPLAYSDTIEAHRAATGVGRSSTVRLDDANPLVRDGASGDYRARVSMSPGSSLTGGAASALGVDNGTARRIGPVGPLVRR